MFKNKKILATALPSTMIATPALAEFKVGDLDLTDYQSAKWQGAGALEAVVALANGEGIGQTVRVPFELVTPENLDKFLQ